MRSLTSLAILEACRRSLCLEALAALRRRSQAALAQSAEGPYWTGIGFRVLVQGCLELIALTSGDVSEDLEGEVCGCTCARMSTQLHRERSARVRDEPLGFPVCVCVCAGVDLV